MSIFDIREKELCEQEKEEAEIIASNEYQKELDEQAEKNSVAIKILSSLNGELTDIIIMETQDFYNVELLSYFEKVSAKFGKLLQEKIEALEKGSKTL